MSGPKTLFDKIWETHVVAENDDGTTLLYIDKHLIHEVTSWTGFEKMAEDGRPRAPPRCHARRARPLDPHPEPRGRGGRVSAIRSGAARWRR